MNIWSFDGLNFTTIFNPETSATKLKVPTRVSKALQNQALEKSLTLRDKYNNMWPVRAGKVDDHWFLQDGWANFLVDCSVIANDRLKFIFSGEDLFDVKIIGSDGNLKEGVGYLKIDDSKKHQSIECDQRDDVDVLERALYGNNTSGNIIPRQKGRDVTCTSKDIFKSGGSKPKSLYPVKGMKTLNANESNKRKSIWIELSEDEEEENIRESEDEVESDNQEKLVKMTPRNAPNGKRHVIHEVKAEGMSSKSPKRRESIGYLGNRLFESGTIPRPEWKYFVKRINPKRLNELYIPKDILLDENLEIPEMMTLVDTRGDEYTSWLHEWNGDRRIYKGGMNKLCRANQLEKDDYCICEFKKEKPGFLYIRFLRKADKSA